MPDAGASVKEVKRSEKYPPGLLSRCPRVDIVNHVGCGSCQGDGTVLPKPRMMHGDIFDRSGRSPFARRPSSIL